MYLQLAAPGDRPGYTFVPFDESDLTKGKYVRNDVLQLATQTAGLSEEDLYLSGFFGKLWSGIKNVASGIVKTGVALVTGNTGQQQQQAAGQPVTVNIPSLPGVQVNPPQQDLIFGMPKQTVMLVGAGLLAVLLLKRK